MPQWLGEGQSNDWYSSRHSVASQEKDYLDKLREEEERRKVREAIFKRAESGKQEKKYEMSEKRKNMGFWDQVGNHAKAWVTDPGQAAHLLLTDERLDRVQDGGVVVPQRRTDLSDRDAGDTSTQVDHKVSLALGGRNDSKNLEVLSNRDNEAKSKVEYWLVSQLNDKKISRKQAQEMNTRWRDYVKDVPEAKKIMEREAEQVTPEQRKVFEYLNNQNRNAWNENKLGAVKDTAANMFYGVKDMADKVTELMTGDDDAEFLRQQSLRADEFSRNMAKKAKEATAKGDTAKAAKYQKLADSYKQSSKEYGEAVGKKVEEVYGKTDMDYYKKVGSLGMQFGLNVGDAFTDVMSFGSKMALKSALKTGAKELIEESGEKASKEAIKLAMKNSGKAVAERAEKNLLESGSKSLAKNAMEGQGKSFFKDVAMGNVKHPFLQAAGQGVYYGGTQSLADSAYYGRDAKETLAALPGDIAVNTAFQMAPAALIAALGKTNAAVVAKAAKKAAGGKALNEIELNKALRAAGMDQDAIAPMTIAEKRAALKDFATNTPKAAEAEANAGLLPPGDRLGNADNPAYFGKERFTDEMGVDDLGNSYISTDRPLESQKNPGKEVGGHTQYGDFGGSSDSYIVNPEFVKSRMTPEAGGRTVVPEIYDGGDNAVAFVRGHEAAHLDSRRPADMPQDVYENAINLKSLRQQADAGVISEEQFVKAKNQAELEAPGSAEAYNRLAGGDVLTTTKETLPGFGPKQPGDFPEIEPERVLEPTNEVIGGYKVKTDDSQKSQAFNRAVQAQQDLADIDTRMTELQGSLESKGLWNEDYDKPEIMSGYGTARDPEVKEWFDLQNERTLASQELSGMSQYANMTEEEIAAQMQKQNPNPYLLTDAVDPNNKQAMAAKLAASEDIHKTAPDMLTEEQLMDDIADEVLIGADGEEIINDYDFEMDGGPIFEHPEMPGVATNARTMELATGRPNTKVDQRVLADAVTDELKDDAKLLDLDGPEPVYIVKSNNKVQDLIGRSKILRRIAAKNETVFASWGHTVTDAAGNKVRNNDAGQAAVRVMRDFQSNKTKFVNEVAPTMDYLSAKYMNPKTGDFDNLQLLMDEIADPNVKELSDDALMLKGVFEKTRAMRNKGGAEIKYLYNYVPDVVDPEKLPEMTAFLDRYGDVPTADGKTIGETFRAMKKDDLLFKIDADTDPKKVKSFSEFKRHTKDVLLTGEQVQKIVDDTLAQNPNADVSMFMNPDGSVKDFRAMYDEFYVTDPMDKVLMYLDSNSKAYAKDMAFKPHGGQDEFMKKLRLEAGDTDVEGKAAADYFADVFNRTVAPDTNRGIEALTNLQIMTKMQMAGFTNSTQSINTGIMFGHGNTIGKMKQVAKAFVDPELMSELEYRAGAYGVELDPISSELERSSRQSAVSERVFGKKRSIKAPDAAAADFVLSASGFKKVERANRLTAMLAAEDYVSGISNKIDEGIPLTKNETRMMQRLGISAEEIAAKGGIDDEMFGRAVNEGVKRAQFTTDPMDLPDIASKGKASRVILALSRFGIKQGEFLKDEVIKEAVLHRNFLPALRYLGSIPVGQANMWIKGVGITAAVNLLLAPFGQKIETKDPGMTYKEVRNPLDAASWAMERAGYAGGFGYLDSLWQNRKYSDSTLEWVTKSMGPVGGDVADVFNVADKYWKGEDDATRTAMAAIAKRLPVPIISGTIKQAVKPHNPAMSKFYDLEDKIGKLGDVKPEDRKMFIEKAMKGENVSETIVGARIINKLYDEDGNEKTLPKNKRIEIRKAIERYGIDRYKALNYADDREDEASSLKKGLNSFERDLASMGKRDREEYLDEIGNSIDDYPNLRRYLESRGESLE